MSVKKAIAILVFRDEDGEEYFDEIGPAALEAVRAEARKDILAWAREGYELADYEIETWGL